MTVTPQPPESARRRTPGAWVVGGLMVLVTLGVVVALLTSQISGTGAENVGSTSESRPPAGGPTAGECSVTESNPGGTNNYIPGASEGADLGDGFVITGVVRSAEGCLPLAGVRIQVWLATETGSESDNRTSVRTDSGGRYRVETSPTVAQFGEPNIHIGYDDGEYESVFLRRVVDLDDDTATIDLNLQPT